ncbi:phage holin family protein [Cognatilysobacter terrigena]|uniref:phage holin family protein n=1 Tax=Cognatilysobacter terrigena TaxID=2488749 RepID=UPI001AADFFDD|nr:phage holin family protein [Lysobacter terrigena]
MTGAGSANNDERPGPADPGVSHGAPPPDLEESLRQVMAAGRSSLTAATDASKALRSLLAADISLARSALGRTVAFTGLAIAFGASAWLLLMASVISLLVGRAGLSWTASLLICALVSVVFCALAAWISIRYFEHTRLQASRRQLARLGFGELADFTPTPGSAASAADIESDDVKTASGEPVKDKTGVPVTPP